MRRLLIAFATVFTLSVAAFGDTLTESYTVNGTFLLNSEVDSTSLQKFDPALGTLNSVSIHVSGTVNYFDAYPAGPAGLVELYGVSTDVRRYHDLVSANEFFDEGRSGYLFVSGSDTDPNDLNEFEGSGNKDLVLDFRGVPSLPSAHLVLSGVRGTLTYDYSPDNTAVTPEPSSLVLFATGLIGVIGTAGKRSV